MIIALFSDIHSNLEALTSVLKEFKSIVPDKYVLIGDIAGYAANPKECIEIVKSINPITVSGNHDFAMAGLYGMEYFNDNAKCSINWTKGILTDEEKNYLGSMPLLYEDKNFTAVHGSLNSPEEFNYIFYYTDAKETFRLMKNDICFVAHTHRPEIFSEGGNAPAYSGNKKIKLDKNKKYIINIGSIGQPRDGDPRASYALFDTKNYTIEIRRVEYNIIETQRKILASGLPKILATRLSAGK